ncbi:MAG: RsmE family RNA methyltransferase [Candidatus Peregrinibacteria bacterium]|nr:RsmE family RNA methyltransferase [Candidatus Peregrinibacteria bacterium]MDZ4244902.1 RsmE family RNA methyltransferase [Candidatus Gracilibacteria bacterium]
MNLTLDYVYIVTSRKLQRFFIEDNVLMVGDDDNLSKEICHQILNVLRMKTNDKVILLDNSGFEYTCEITVHGKNISYKVLEKNKNTLEPTINTILYQSILKSSERLEFAMQKATELGVMTIVPLITERCQVATLRKKDRFEKIIKEASEQSERGLLPTLENPIKFNDLIKTLDTSLKTTNLFFYEGARHDKFELPSLSKNVNVIIGPEGGFSPEEALQIETFCKKNKNSYTLSLGKRILRSETASIVALAQILINY